TTSNTLSAIRLVTSGSISACLKRRWLIDGSRYRAWAVSSKAVSGTYSTHACPVHWDVTNQTNTQSHTFMNRSISFKLNELYYQPLDRVKCAATRIQMDPGPHRHDKLLIN